MYPPTSHQHEYQTPPASHIPSPAGSFYSGLPPAPNNASSTQTFHSGPPPPAPNNASSTQTFHSGPPPSAPNVPSFASTPHRPIPSQATPVPYPSSSFGPGPSAPVAFPINYSGSLLPAPSHSSSIVDLGSSPTPGPTPPVTSPTLYPSSSIPAPNHSPSVVNLAPPSTTCLVQHSSSIPQSRSSPMTHSEPSTSHQQPDNGTRTQDNPIDLIPIILQKIDQLVLDVAALRRKADQSDTEEEESFEPPTGFPLRNLEQFDIFENNQSQMKLLQRHLEFVGGQNLRDALHRFVRSSMSNNLAENFTWTGKSNGQQNKRALYSSKLAKIFYRAAKKVKRVGKFTGSEFIANMREILRSYKQTARNARLPSTIQGQRKRRREDEERLFPDHDDDDDDDDDE